MSLVKIPELPVAIGLTGAEPVEIVQGGTSKQTTTGGIAQLSGTAGGSAEFVVLATALGLPNARVLVVESGVLFLLDGGAGANVEIGIEDGGVTNVKLADMADQTLKGNISGALATPADLTLAQVMGAAAFPTPVTAAGAYNVPVNALSIIINKTDGANVVLPALALKVGPVKIIGQNADVHPFNVTVTDGTIMGLSSYPFTGAWQSVTFSPYVAGSVWTT